jgi:predicted metal-dependent phosphoesterase TrpH
MNNELIDMHTHTCYSDGELTPNELLKLAIKNGVGTISITDHDTIQGLININYESEEAKQINIIPGIELSVKAKKGTFHILGYGIDINNEYLNNKLKELRSNSLNRVLSMLEQLKKEHGIIFGYDEIVEMINANHNLGRPDIAKLCIKNGYVNNIREAFAKYLIEAYRKTAPYNKCMSYQECIELILISGGIPVLAHPYSLEMSDLELFKLVKDMVKHGLKGIEVYHPKNSEEERKIYMKLVDKFNLLISGGSDYHGKIVKPNVEIGSGINNNICIKKLSLLNHLNI